MGNINRELEILRKNKTEMHGLSQWLSGEESAGSAGAIGDSGSIPGSGRSPGGAHDKPLQYSHLENPRTEDPGGLQFAGK